MSLAAAVRRGWRRLERLGRPPAVELVYSPRYVVPISGVPHDAERGERILTFLAAEGLLHNEAIHEPEPISLKSLERIHAGAYLEALRDRDGLTRLLGFRAPDPLQDRVLALQRHMAGGTVLAARLALHGGGASGLRVLAGRGRVVVHLGGGFHHAFRDRGARFCVFNDVAAAVSDRRRHGFSAPILIVDLDLHDGDGTRQIFAADPTVHTFSIHNQTNDVGPAAAATVVELGGGVDDATYLEAVRTHLPPVFAAVEPGLVVYLAGADPAFDDAIGDWNVTPRGLLERDRFVAGLAGATPDPTDRPRVPFVVLLAGGYGHGAWRYPARFVAWLHAGRALEPPSTDEVTLMRYRRLARRFDPSELTGEGSDEDWGLTEADVLGSLEGVVHRTRLLGFYSKHGLELALERGGLFDRVRDFGFGQPNLEFDLDNPSGETVRLWGDARRTELLMELRVHRDSATLSGLEMLRVEWLLLQNPRRRFSPERPPLPGQRHPGLGLLRDVVAFLVLACERLELDGVLFVPSHYHTATQSKKLLRFLKPEHEARFRALRQALRGLDLPAATRAVDDHRLRDAASGEPFAWEPVPMVLPVSERLRARVMGEEYEAEVAAAADRYRFELG